MTSDRIKNSGDIQSGLVHALFTCTVLDRLIRQAEPQNGDLNTPRS